MEDKTLNQKKAERFIAGVHFAISLYNYFRKSDYDANQLLTTGCNFGMTIDDVNNYQVMPKPLTSRERRARRRIRRNKRDS